MSETDYEALRRKNIAERKALFADFFKEIEAEKAVTRTKKPKAERVEYASDDDTENRPPRKKRRLAKVDYQKEVTRTYNTRSRTRRMSGSGESDADERKQRLVPKGRQLKVMFPWSKPFEREIEMMRTDKWDVDKEIAEAEEWEKEDENDSDDDDDDDDDDDEEFKYSGRTRAMGRVSKAPYDPSSIPSPDEITEAMLRNVASRSSGKEYCKTKGTSCHQCRQKTMDTKTVCRSGECIGVRGQFCGPCLRGRYGEDAVTVLKDPNWACPPCRGLCNCSICRTRNGQRPTGILAPIAQEEGFTSVKDYLLATSADDELEEPEGS